MERSRAPSPPAHETESRLKIITRMEPVSAHVQGIIRKGKPTAEGLVRPFDSVIGGHDETMQGNAFAAPPVAAPQIEISSDQLVLNGRLRISVRENRPHFRFLQEIISKPADVNVSVSDSA